MMDRCKTACGLVAAVALGLVLASDAIAAEGRAAAPAEQPAYLAYAEKGLPGTPGAATLVGRVLGSLALVLGLIIVAAFVVKRWLGAARVAVAGKGKVSQLVEVTPLGGKRFLYLIRVADRLLVVGAGGERMELLSEIRDPEVLGQIEETTQARKTDFLNLLRRMRGRPEAHDEPKQEAATP